MGVNGLAYECTDEELSNGVYFVGVAPCYHCEVQNSTRAEIKPQYRPLFSYCGLFALFLVLFGA